MTWTSDVVPIEQDVAFVEHMRQNKPGVYGILDRIVKRNGHASRMLHKVPHVPTVKSRVDWLVDRVKDKVIVDLGSAGTDGQCTVFKKLAVSAKKAFGIDSQETQIPTIAQCDLDSRGYRKDCLPWYSRGMEDGDEIELVVAGELLEHLVNPGLLLQDIAESYPGAELIITVPNAFSKAALQGNTECVNVDHCCWFSWRTLTTLVEKCGWQVVEWFWYNGVPLRAEGLIFVCREQTDGGIGSSEEQAGGPEAEGREAGCSDRAVRGAAEGG